MLKRHLVYLWYGLRQTDIENEVGSDLGPLLRTTPSTLKPQSNTLNVLTKHEPHIPVFICVHTRNLIYPLSTLNPEPLLCLTLPNHKPEAPNSLNQGYGKVPAETQTLKYYGQMPGEAANGATLLHGEAGVKARHRAGSRG